MKKHFATSTTLLETPCGQLLLGAESGRLCLCSWLHEIVATTITSDVDGQLLSEACRQLREYFAHERLEFQLPLSMHGTPFQQSAWKAMLTIPYGQTISYAEEALRAGHPTALRAIGNANGRNPLAIIVPCHRVIASNGQLGGYSSGLDYKRFLLRLEGVACR